MVADTLTLTFEDIDDIYRAGMKRGQDEAVSFEWGSHCAGKTHDELIEALYGIFNRGLSFDDPNYRSYDVATEWVNTQLAAKS